MAGFRFELPVTIDDMLDHLQTTPGALPLLQFAASKLWDARDKNRKMLTHSSYTAMGGVAGALASHADRVVDTLGGAGLVRSILLRLVTPERTRAIVPMAELRELSREVGEVQRLVDQMVDARLLVVQTLEGGKGSTVEIVHESLVSGWPMLRRWLDENQDDAALVDQLRTASRQWQAKGQDSGLLWRGDMADEAKKFTKRYKGPLSDVERGFLVAVVQLEQAAIRRKRRNVIAGFIILSGIVVAAMVALVIVQRAKAEADKNFKAAEVASGEAKKERGIAEQRLVDFKKEQAEKERIDAEKRKVAIDLAKSEGDLTAAYGELKIAYADVQENLKKVEEAKARAEKEKEIAKKAQADAVAAKEETGKALSRTKELLTAEKASNEEMKKQLGSTTIDVLK